MGLFRWVLRYFSTVVALIAIASQSLHCLLFFVSGRRSGCSTLLSNTSRWSLSVRRVNREINVLLGGSSDVEGRDGDQLRSDTNVTLSDQDTGVVNGLCKTLFVDLGLESALQQLLCCQLKNSIEFQLVVSQQTVTAHSTEECGSLKNTFGVFRVQCQQGTCGLSQFGKCVLNTPDLTLTAEAILSNQFQLGI